MNAQDATQIARRFVQLPAHKRPLFLDALAGEGVDFSVLPIAADAAAQGQTCVSYAQQRMWFLWQLDPRSAAYHLPMLVRLRGELRREALQTAFDALIARHEALRTVFIEDDQGELAARVDAAGGLGIELHDVSALAGAQQAQQLQALCEARIAQPFDLAQGPLLRAELLKLGPQEHVLLLVAHHIVADGWSLKLLVEEVVGQYQAACQGRPNPLAPLPIQYRDYAVWQRSWLQAGGETAQLAYWREHLGDTYLPLALPYDYPGNKGRDTEGARLELMLDSGLQAQLRSVASRHDATLFMVLLASFKLLLQRYCGARTVRVGVPVANRNRAETEGLIGCFINTQLLQTDIDPALDAGALIRRVKATALGAQAHQDVPLERLVEALGLAGGQARQAAFEVLFNHQSAVDDIAAQVEVAGLTLEPMDLARHSARFDLALDTYEQAGHLRARFTYAKGLFEAASVQRLGEHWLELLAWLARDDSQAIGDWALSSSWAEPATATVAGECIHTLIERAALRHPQQVAVVGSGRSLSYEALLGHARSLAQVLGDEGCGAEAPIAVVADRSPEMIIGMLAVLLAGATYVPLDPEQPAERLRLMVSDARVKRLIVTSEVPVWADAVQCLGVYAQSPQVFVPVQVEPAQLAYVIFTSGTTGRPKGVAVSHGALTNYVSGLSARIPLDGIRHLAMVSTPAADLGHTVLFTALSHGRTLHLFDKRTVLDSQQFGREMAQVDMLKIVPSHLQALLDAGEGDVLPKRCLVLGGEAVRPALLQQIAHRAPGLLVLNHYGPTETTVGVLTSELSADDTEPCLGTALEHLVVRVLDGSLLPAPGGVPGELCIAGAGLARGYLRQPGLTAERFVPDPYGAPGGRLYRSGDRVRRNRQGQPVFCGRGDGQVKVRGYRIETAEIEHYLTQCPGVRQARVRLHGQGDSAQLIGYVIAAEGSSQLSLLQALRAHLPEPMLPSRILMLDAFPLTANGKLDFHALPLPEASLQTGEFQTPINPLHIELAELWARVLGVERVGMNDNFFALGGHSLLATQVISRVRRQLAVDVPLRALFDTPDLRGFALAVAAARPDHQGDIARVSREAPLPVSHAQHRQWLFWKLHPASTAYHTPLAVRLTGALDTQALESAFNGLVQRHETLRTHFVETDGMPSQHVLTTMPFVLARQSALGQDDAQLATRIQAAIATPFDLATGPLLRGLLLTLGEESHLLVLTLHHIVSDGWSMGIMVRECLRTYEALVSNRSDGLQAPKVQYADYAVWQRQRLEQGLLHTQLAYWKTALENDFSVLALPADRARPTVQSHHGERIDLRLSPALAEQLRALAIHHQATLFHVLLAAFGLVLGRYTGREKLNIGVPMTNRDRVELEGLMGFFVNTLVVRIGLDPAQDLAAYLAQVKETTLQAQANKDIPFDALVEALSPERDTSHNPLFQVMYNHLRDVGAQVGEHSLSGLHLQEVDLAGHSAQFDLALDTLERSDGVLASFTFATDLFDRPRIERLAQHWLNLLQAFVEGPVRAVGELPMLCLPETQRLAEANLTPAHYPASEAIHQLFERQARLTPQALALVHGDQQWSYQVLNQRANALSAALIARGVARGSRVAIVMKRTPDMVAALFAVMKAGAAYIPLDPAYPVQRLNYMLKDSEASLLLVQGDSCPALALEAHTAILDVEDIQAVGQGNLDLAMAPQDLAYCIYTSGSTGQPKGVMIEHRNVAALIGWSASVYSQDDLQGVLASTSICFDLSAWEFFVTLALGGYVILAENVLQLPQLPARDRVRLINTVPSAIRTLCEARQIPDSVRVINTAGELFKQSVVEALYKQKPAVRVYDLYGPSEDTTYSTFTLREVGGTDNIGGPIANSAAYLMDDNAEQVPWGHAAQVYMAGAGLARGYLNRPGLTAERFVPDPLAARGGERMYRTGDLARYDDAGRLECLGRIDHQVKVRGFRIELGEIEARLRAFHGVRDVAVVALEQVTGSELVAYLVPTDQAQALVDPASQAAVQQQLRAHLRAALPDYMVPAHWVMLQALPLTPNGKLDRAKLPTPDRQARPRILRAPLTPLAAQVAELWSQALGVAVVGMDDNFFELGGHSLLATQVTARLQAQLNIELPLLELFQAPSLEAFVQAVERCQPGNQHDLEELGDWMSELETL